MTLLLIAIIVFSVAGDQVSKALIFGHDSAFIPGLIRFESTKNQGMAWGLMHGVSWFLPAVSVLTGIVIVLLLVLLFRSGKHMSAGIRIGFACVIGGAIGNLIDRVSLGYVRDFICTEFIEFPVFNVADIFVTCGGILLAVLLIFTKSGHRFFNYLLAEPSKKKNEPKEN
ncbi:MAG: signal peptidase II [Clostridia bacterium]|nr:signal peptidase II [Clostridia bacterium]